MSGEPTPGAVRLIFEYEGDQVRLVSQQPVDMTVVPPGPEEVDRVGHFVETRDRAGARISRIPVHGGFQDSAEVFPENPEEPITRVDAEPRGAFTVVVPAPEAMANVAVIRVRPPRQLGGLQIRGVAPVPNEELELGAFRIKRGRGRQR